MKVLALFLLLSRAFAQAQDASQAGGIAASASELGDASPVLTTTPASKLAEGSAAPEISATYEPLFNFDLAPYNVALEIVASALEKLADVMEPIDLPLPLVGPGYYLEVQVKSPKNAHGAPFSQINVVSIEGGFAQPMTEIDIILPGDSTAHQTILIPAASQNPSSDAESYPAEVLTSAASAPTPVPRPEPESFPTESVSGSLTESPMVSSKSHALSSSLELPPFLSSIGGLSEEPSVATMSPTELPNLTESEAPEELSENRSSGKSEESSEAPSEARTPSSSSGLPTPPQTSSAPTEISSSLEPPALIGIDESSVGSIGVSSSTSASISSAASASRGLFGNILGQLASNNVFSDQSSAIGAVGTPGHLQPTESVPVSSDASSAVLPTLAPLAPLGGPSSLASPSSADAMSGMGPPILGIRPSSSSAPSSESSLAIPPNTLSDAPSSPILGMSAESSILSSSSALATTGSSSRQGFSGGLFNIFGGLGASSGASVGQSLSIGFAASGLQSPGSAVSASVLASAPADLLTASSAAASLAPIPLDSSSLAISEPSPLTPSSADVGMAGMAPTSAPSADEPSLEPAASSISPPSDRTMESALLPFPPFGSFVSQAASVAGLRGSASTAIAASGAATATSEPEEWSDGGVKTIDIVSATDENQLESSVDAILHSVIDGYKTVSVPKAAVGFALIHPRRGVVITEKQVE
ncbi:hypothetical protein GQ54DRAFT_336101 [Martensiomyces pterosporus]|nr:hypothetical protein GQ54DRAFT_336101 [Martensiomyces pterosporus]